MTTLTEFMLAAGLLITGAILFHFIRPKGLRFKIELAWYDEPDYYEDEEPESSNGEIVN